MPITLGCPSCKKRFRARDESAGKRVKCPHCGAAVTVPLSESASPSEPLSGSIPVSPPRSGTMLPGSGSIPSDGPRSGSVPTAAPAPVATPDDWGASPPPPKFTFEVEEPSPYQRPTAASASTAKSAAPRAVARPVGNSNGGNKSPEQMVLPAWRKARSGLFWVLFGLLLLTIPGLVGFGKLVYARAVGELPRGEGWVSIPGYVNSDEAGSVRMSKLEQLDVALYALPVILGVFFIGIGRLTCAAAPRNSGAKQLFLWSGLFTLVALVGLVLAGACNKLLFEETYGYAALGFLVTASLAEFWFLTGLTASGLALKRPGVARAVGLVGFVAALVAVAYAVGWEQYAKELRPKPLTDDWNLYEQAGVMLGWLLLIGVYWRAVRTVRAAIRDFIDKAEDQS